MFQINSADTADLITIGVCLVLSAFFSASETAITSLGSLKAKHLLDLKGPSLKHLRLWISRPSHVLTTILIFNNAVNIYASAIATKLATKYFENQAVGISTGVITFLVLIFGEVIPKSYAKTHYEKLSIFTLRIIRILYFLIYPLVFFLSGMASIIVARFSKKHDQKPPITEEELEFLINVSKDSGVIENEKKEMITGVFDFDETKVREIMTPRTDICALEESKVDFNEALKIIIEEGHSRIPIYRDRIDNIVGTILAKDLLKLVQKKASGQASITEIIRPPFFTPDSKPILEVFRELKRGKNHLAIVVDEDGGTAGLVTLEDILEEIVGEIKDEHDQDELQDILEKSPTTFDVTGSCSLNDFLEYFSLEDNALAQDADVDTVGGWVTELIGEMPKKGQQVSVGSIDIEVTAVDLRRINLVRVTKNTYIDDADEID